MSSSDRFLEMLPDSIYARELAGNGDGVAFAPAVEAAFGSYYLAERHTSNRVFNLIMLLCSLAGLATVVLDPGLGTGPFEPWRLGLIVLVYAVLAATAYSAVYERIYLRTASVAWTLLAIVVPVECACRIAIGEGWWFALVTSCSFALYYLAGQLYPPAVRSNGVLVLSLGLALVFLRQPLSRIAGLEVGLAANALIIGVAFRKQATRFRRAFLERCIVQEIAACDRLTGISNRGAFNDHLQRVWLQGLRERRRLVLFMLDVDRFKPFNDRYGHQMGDAALQAIAGVVKAAASRPLDLAARYGGEELALVLYDTTPERARALAEELRLAVRGLGIAHRDSPVGAVTASIGVAIALPTGERSCEGFVQLADQALYEAKRQGRDRVTVFEQEYDSLDTGRFRMAGSGED